EERDQAQQVAARLEPYLDILQDTRSYLPLYIRNKALIDGLLIKLRKIFNRQTDINQATESGRKAAHRIVDGAMECILQGALLEWHKHEARIREKYQL
ncbi:MAG: hypothetical protein ACXAEN_24030, partial [Candidatus Thorarchaeota archaeon]